VMVSMDTLQPSRPLSLMSNSMPMKGGSARTYLQQHQQQQQHQCQEQLCNA
jgi:hypothetical protein